MDKEEFLEILRRMEEQGMAPKVLFKEVPVVTARIACGSPAELGDTGIEYYREWPEDLLNYLRAVAVQVTGDSMVDAGYVDGDEVLVDLERPAEAGDVIAAMLDGDCTVKVLTFDDEKRPWLIPQNESMNAIPVSDGSDFRVLGVVTGLFRRKRKVHQSDYIGYLIKAKAKGRPRSRALADITSDIHLEQLHHAIDGNKGKMVAKTFKYANDKGWFRGELLFPAIQEEFGDIGSRQLFSRYFNIELTKSEVKSIEQALNI